jgi:hypothetical protein
MDLGWGWLVLALVLVQAPLPGQRLRHSLIGISMGICECFRDCSRAGRRYLVKVLIKERDGVKRDECDEGARQTRPEDTE